MFHNVTSVCRDTGDGFRPECVEKVKPTEVQTGLVAHDPSDVFWLAALVEYGQVDPGESGLKSCAPDHIGNFESVSLVGFRKTVANATDSGNSQIGGQAKRGDYLSGADRFCRQFLVALLTKLHIVDEDTTVFGDRIENDSLSLAKAAEKGPFE